MNKKIKKVLKWTGISVGALFALFILIGILNSGSDTSAKVADPTPQATETPKATPEAPKETAKPEPTATPEPKVDEAAKAAEIAASNAKTSEVQFNEMVDKMIAKSNGIVVGVRIQPNHAGDYQWMEVAISDEWYKTPKFEQQRFVETLGGTIENYVHGSGLIATDKNVVVDFVDSYGKQIAEEGIFTGDYKIKE
jgi:hypothetical protein